ncbi:hypothetical protein ACIRN4_20400 [Pimelobacter simplex]|uniref:hypothetical protein n=1 Tax=Nocardioides simplex TaxID=2045 RepID=UPI0038304906
MSYSPGRIAVTAVTVGLLGSTLSGCGLLDGSSRLEKALEYLPAGTRSVQFVDRAKIADRLDLDDLATGASEDDVRRWAEASKDEAYGTELARWLAPMQEAAFSDFDVEWEVIGTGDGGLTRIWRMSDDLDFDKVAADLEDAGYERSGSKDRPVFHADIADAADSLVGGRYPIPPLDLALVPGEELIVTGTAVDEVLDAVDDDADSLADEGSFGDLLDQADDRDDVEYAAMTLDLPCAPPGVRDAKGEGMGLFVPSDETVRAVRMFDSDKAATADVASLDDALTEFEQLAGVEGPPEVTTDGSVVRIEMGFDERRSAASAYASNRGPFACLTAPPATP